jgi:hypothetical protein
MTHRKIISTILFWSAGWSFLGGQRLGRPFWRPRDKNISLRHLIQQYNCKIWQFLVIESLDTNPHWPKMQDPGPYTHWNQCRSTTLVINSIVSDPDPDWIRIQLGTVWSRFLIRIQIQMIVIKKNWLNFMFWSAKYSIEGLEAILYLKIRHGGLKTTTVY